MSVAGARAGVLPSPSAPLSPSPPLGGATSSRESVRHHVRSSIRVAVSLLPSGAPFAVAAEQTLAVSVQGDYFLTIAAPLLGVEPLPGSDSVPGRRRGSIIWAGFNPGTRTLRAKAELVPGPAAAQLPLRIERHGSRTTLVNSTRVRFQAVSADADAQRLDRYVRRLHEALLRGLPLPEPTAGPAGATRTTQVQVSVPLQVEGSVGTHRVSAVISGSLIVSGRGRVALTVRPTAPAAPQLAGAPGRTALARATAFILTVARLRQYERYLANPDPAGASATVYSYRTATPPRIATAVGHSGSDDGWTRTIAIAAALLLAAGGGLALWARA